MSDSMKEHLRKKDKVELVNLLLGAYSQIEFLEKRLARSDESVDQAMNMVHTLIGKLK